MVTKFFSSFFPCLTSCGNPAPIESFTAKYSEGSGPTPSVKLHELGYSRKEGRMDNKTFCFGQEQNANLALHILFLFNRIR